MRSTSMAGLLRQSGQSLVEAVVAAALLGIAVVAGITAIETGTSGAQIATQQARGQCLVREEAAYLEALPWSVMSGSDLTGWAADPRLTVTINTSAPSPDPSSAPNIPSPKAPVYQLTITYADPRTGSYSATIVKAYALSNGSAPTPPSAAECPPG